LILPLTNEQLPIVCKVFGQLPLDFAFGNCVAWLELSTQPSPLAADYRRGKGAGWLFYQDNTASHNELGGLLQQQFDLFNSNPVYVTVNYATT